MFNRKLILILILPLSILAIFWALNNASAPIKISNAKALKLNDRAYAIYADIENLGPPDRLLGINSKNLENLMIMGMTYGENLVLPEGGTASFSSDGAHIMLFSDNQSWKAGEFIPLSLELEQAGTIQMKAIVRDDANSNANEETSGETMMDHSMHGSVLFDIETNQLAPKLEMSIDQRPDDSWSIKLKTENFEFLEPTENQPKHVIGQGHGHLYLNGLKLGRVYSTKAVIGRLPSGKHEVSVTLNTNDHRAYAVDEKPVAAKTIISVQ